MYDRVIRGGRVITDGATFEAQVAIKDGVIAAMGTPGSNFQAEEVVDATGKLVIPGGIDGHVHVNTWNALVDDFKQASISGAYGGITTILPYIRGKPEMSVPEFLDVFIGTEDSVLDFAIHCGVQPASVESIPESFPRGIPSIKLHMDYKARGLMLSDDLLFRAMELTGQNGGLALVHAEIGDMVDYLQRRAEAEGRTSNEQFYLNRPNFIESEAVARAIRFAEAAKCALYVVHLSTREALDEILRARNANKPVFTETCPQYLTLTDEEVVRHGGLYKVGPPLRTRRDNEAMWWGIQQGTIEIIGSDHAAYTLERKTRTEFSGEEVTSIWESPYGFQIIEPMMSLIFSEGVVKGRITLEKWVDVFSCNAAKRHGLWPRKGTIRVGADADVVLWDPEVEWVIHVEDTHSNGDYTPWEDWRVTGRPVASFLRGEPLLDGGELRQKPGFGKFLPRKPIWHDAWRAVAES